MSLIFFILFILLILFIIVLVAVGICIGIAYLMAYFIPTLDLNNALTPAAILATVLILALAGTFKTWISESIKNSPLLTPRYNDDDDDDEEPSVITKNRSHRSRRNWR